MYVETHKTKNKQQFVCRLYTRVAVFETRRSVCCVVRKGEQLFAFKKKNFFFYSVVSPEDTALVFGRTGFGTNFRRRGPRTRTGVAGNQARRGARVSFVCTARSCDFVRRASSVNKKTHTHTQSVYIVEIELENCLRERFSDRFCPIFLPCRALIRVFIRPSDSHCKPVGEIVVVANRSDRVSLRTDVSFAGDVRFLVVVARPSENHRQRPTAMILDDERFASDKRLKRQDIERDANAADVRFGWRRFNGRLSVRAFRPGWWGRENAFPSGRSKDAFRRKKKNEIDFTKAE